MFHFLVTRQFPIPTTEDEKHPQAEPLLWTKKPDCKLRDEQKRALAWMQQRESGGVPFVAEMYKYFPVDFFLGGADWRMEFLLKPAFHARGGVLADR